MRTKNFRFSTTVILALFLVSVGITVGGNAQALTISTEELAQLLSFKGLPTQEMGVQPTEPMVGQTTNEEYWVYSDSGAIYIGNNRDVGLRRSSGQFQYLQGGVWSNMGGSTPGDEGWLANAQNTLIYPATNISGTYYYLVLGGNATTTPWTTDYALYLANSKGILSSGAIRASSTLQVTDATVLYSTLAVTGASTLTGNVTMAGTLAVTGTTALTGAVTTTGALTVGTDLTTVTAAVTGAVTVQGGIDTVAAKALRLGTSTATAVEIADTGITTTVNGPLTVDEAATLSSTVDITGAVTAASNITATGNVSAANGTFTGSLTVDTTTLYVDNSNNIVGIGTTSPVYVTGANLVVEDGIAVYDDTSPYDVLAKLYDPGTDDDGGLAIFANAATSTLLLANGTSYFTGGTVGIGTTTSVDELSILEATNAQLRLSYDGDNYARFTTGSGGDLTIAPSGGDLAVTGTTTSSTALGVATSSQYGKFVIEQGVEERSVYISNSGSSTPSLVVNGVNGNGAVGIATSTPFKNAIFSMGSGGATTTMATGRFCMIAETEAGTLYYIRLSPTQTQVFATSTTPCY